MDPKNVYVNHRAPEKVKRKLLDQIATVPYPPSEALLEFATRMQQDESFRTLALTVIREYRSSYQEGRRPSKASGLASRFRKDPPPQQDYLQMAKRLQKKVDLLIVKGKFNPQRFARDVQSGLIDPVIVRTPTANPAGDARPGSQERRQGGLATIDESTSRGVPRPAGELANGVAGRNVGPINSLLVVRGPAGGLTTKEMYPQPRSRI